MTKTIKDKLILAVEAKAYMDIKREALSLDLENHFYDYYLDDIHGNITNAVNGAKDHLVFFVGNGETYRKVTKILHDRVLQAGYKVSIDERKYAYYGTETVSDIGFYLVIEWGHVDISNSERAKLIKLRILHQD